jgi:hypothetical protein
VNRVEQEKVGDTSRSKFHLISTILVDAFSRIVSHNLLGHWGENLEALEC